MPGRTAPDRPGETDGSPIRAMTRREFQKLQSYIYQESGIFLAENKKALVVGRLTRRLRILGLTSFSKYYDYLCEHPESERTPMLDRICTNKTSFFREPKQFEFLRSEVFPRWREEGLNRGGPRFVRAWSAGCSTGQEPYSLAMLFQDQFPAAGGWTTEIWATDLSTRALDQARSGVWPMKRTEEIPKPYAKRYMLRGTGSQEGVAKAGPEIRSLIRFDQVNLSRPPYPGARPFDLIFCRNVLIYFDQETRMRVIDHLIGRLTDRGLLLLGHAESLFGQTNRVRGLIPSVYERTDVAGSTAGDAR